MVRAAKAYRRSSHRVQVNLRPTPLRGASRTLRDSGFCVNKWGVNSGVLQPDMV